MKKAHIKDVKTSSENSQSVDDNQAHYKDYAEASADWFWESDADLNITSIIGNAKYFDVSNLSEIAHSCYSHSSNEVFKLFETQQKFTDCIFLTSDKAEDGVADVYTRISGKPIYAETGTFIGYRGAGRDVTEIINLARRADFLASHDELTGLPNRSMFRQRLEHATAKAKRAGTQLLLLFFDLDSFKTVNQTLGSDVGDELLVQAVERIGAYTRSTDVLCRLGGDEFVMMMEGASPKDGHRIIREIINGFAEPFSVQNQDVLSPISIGVSVFPDDTAEPQQLLVFADLALYRAKNNTQNNFEFYAANLNHAAHEWFEMEQSLGQALQNKQMFMMYQPQFNAVTKKITGIEALLRWRHPELGLVPPIEFIKIAEQSALINQIGEFVINACCEQIQLWLDADINVPRVSINISYQHLRSDFLVKTLIKAANKFDIKPSMICIEISERALLEGEHEVRKNMLAIKEAGFSISLDDFGMAHASLLDLKRWAIDEVKIDRTFVSNLNKDNADNVIVEAIIALSEILGVNLIGEGVENEDQISMLTDSGCETMQGFYYAEPLLAKDLEKRLKK